MKKLLLIASLSIALISCGEKDPELPNPGIQGDVKLVDQIITSGQPDYDGTLTFEYDESNRVTRIKMDHDRYNYSKDIHYGNNEITITQKNELDELSEVATIESGNRIKSYLYRVTLSDKIDSERVYNYDFAYDEANCLKVISFGADADSALPTSVLTDSFSWTDGNIAEMKFSVKLSDIPGGFIDFRRETLTYNEVENNKINLDLNWLQFNEYVSEPYGMFPVMGYFGKPCKNYISTITAHERDDEDGEGATYTQTIKYEFDTDGCPVKIDVYGNQGELSISHVITYKK